MGAGTDVEAASIKVREEPLVHIHIEAVEGREVVRYMSVFVKNESCAGIGCVYVDPDPCGDVGVSENLCDLVEMIRGARVCGTKSGS